MTGADKTICQAAALLLVLTLASAPAQAQLAGFGGAGGGDMMTQMAPMLEMMKAKMGKRRFAMLMQTMGPMMSRMMEGGGLGGLSGGGAIPGGLGGAIPGGYGGGTAFAPQGYGVGAGVGTGVGLGGNDIAGLLGGSGGGELMSMIPQLMRLANFGGGHGRRHHRRGS
jgi:hypothetical protein